MEEPFEVFSPTVFFDFDNFNTTSLEKQLNSDFLRNIPCPSGMRKKLRRKKSELPASLYQCTFPDCSRSYTTVGGLNQHYKVKHNKDLKRKRGVMKSSCDSTIISLFTKDYFEDSPHSSPDDIFFSSEWEGNKQPELNGTLFDSLDKESLTDISMDNHFESQLESENLTKNSFEEEFFHVEEHKIPDNIKRILEEYSKDQMCPEEMENSPGNFPDTSHSLISPRNCLKEQEIDLEIIRLKEQLAMELKKNQEIEHEKQKVDARLQSLLLSNSKYTKIIRNTSFDLKELIKFIDAQEEKLKSSNFELNRLISDSQIKSSDIHSLQQQNDRWKFELRNMKKILAQSNDSYEKIKAEYENYSKIAESKSESLELSNLTLHTQNTLFEEEINKLREMNTALEKEKCTLINSLVQIQTVVTSNIKK